MSTTFSEKFSFAARKIWTVIKNPKFYCLFFVILISAVYTLATFNRHFPVSEGWYTVYAQLIRSGKKPYLDFEFLYTPVYAYLITLFTQMFGYELIWLRLAGAAVFVSIAVLAYFIFKLVFHRKIASVCALLTVFVMQSELPQIFYDYIRIYDLCNFLGIYLYLKFYALYKDGKIKSCCRYSFFAGIALSVSFLVRQSSGLINLFAGFAFLTLLLTDRQQRKTFFRAAVWYAAGALLAICALVIWLLANGLLGLFIEKVFLDASASKGGMVTILFGWLLNLASSVQLAIIAAVAIAFILAIIYLLYRNRQQNLAKKAVSDKFSYLIFIIFCFISLIFMFLSPAVAKILSMSGPWVVAPLFFVLNLVIAVTLFYNVFVKKNRKYILPLILSIFILSTAFGSGTSGGITEGQGALAYGFIMGIVLTLIRFNKRYALYNAIALCVCAVIFTGSTGRKVVTSYSWWGLSEPAFHTAQFESSIPLLRGIKLSDDTKYMIEVVTDTIVNGTSEGDSIYCFPNIPIFYHTTGIMPEVYAVVGWYDVASDRALLNDLEYLKQNLPEYIVYADLDDYVRQYHESRFRKNNTSAQAQIFGWIDGLLETGIYETEKTYDLTNGGEYPYKLHLLKLVK